MLQTEEEKQISLYLGDVYHPINMSRTKTANMSSQGSGKQRKGLY
jgi:hypothetical protein